MSDAAIEELLHRAGGGFAFPATPSLAAGVMAQIDAQPAPRRGLLDSLRAWWQQPARWIAAGAAAAIAVVAVASLLAVPSTRAAIADFFGFGNVRVEVEPEAPEAPLLSPQSFAAPAALGEAQAAVDFPLRLPAADGVALQPDAVYLRTEGGKPVAILSYDGYDLYQTRDASFGKTLRDEDDFQEIEFDGHPALWIAAGGHIASFLDEEGRVVVESRREVDRATLFWQEGGVTYRLETSLPQAEAIEVARSLR
jgi:hypothetical protein